MKITNALSGFLTLSFMSAGVLIWAGAHSFDALSSNDLQTSAKTISAETHLETAHLLSPANLAYVDVDPFAHLAHQKQTIKKGSPQDITHLSSLFPTNQGAPSSLAETGGDLGKVIADNAPLLKELPIGNPLFSAVIDGIANSSSDNGTVSQPEDPLLPNLKEQSKSLAEEYIKVGQDGLRLTIPGIGSYAADPVNGITLSAPGISASIGKSGLKVRETGDSLGHPSSMPNMLTASPLK